MVPTDLRLRRSIIVAAGAVALAVGGVATVWPTPSTPRPTVVVPVVDERVVAGPLDGRTAAWLTVGDAAARVRVRFARLPGQLYRISTASDAGVVPVVSRRDGRVTLRLIESDGDGLDEVRIVLNRNVRWDIRLPAGAGEQQLNLRDGRVQRVEVGAAGLAEVWLPDPDGTVPVVFTGGIGTAVVSVRRGIPVRVHLAEGAGSVEAPWIANNGTAAGTVFREPEFPEARDRYAIRAEDGIGALVIRRPPDRVTPGTIPDAVVQAPAPGPVVQRRPDPEPEDPGPAVRKTPEEPGPAVRKTRRTVPAPKTAPARPHRSPVVTEQPVRPKPKPAPTTPPARSTKPERPAPAVEPVRATPAEKPVSAGDAVG